MAEEHYYLPLYYIYFYIYTIIIISILIFVNAVYNIIVYINIILNKYSDDVVLIENNKLSKSKVYDESKLLIGDTVDYKLFISTFIDNHFNYCDKYFTLNITRSLLKLFIIFTIISIVFLFITLLWDWMGKDDIDFNNKKCHEYIMDNCILINNNINVKGFDKLKLAGIAIIIAILFIIFIIDFTIQNTIYVKYIVDWDKDKTQLNEDFYRYRNIETYLNTYIDTANGNYKHVLDTENNNIDMLINHLKGYNIDTIENIKNITNSANSANIDEYNLFIARVKGICAKIKEKNITQINKDLDFVNLVIIFLNNMKTFNDNRNKNIIKGSGFNVYFLSISTIFNDIINVITNIIPVFPGIEKIKDEKIDAYNLYNILIGGVPLSIHKDILNDSEDCKDIIEYEKSLDNNISVDKETDRKKCIYYNYLYDLKKISWKNKLQGALIAILVFAIISVIIIILLFGYIYINYSAENIDRFKLTSINLIRSAKFKNLGYLGLGYIIKNLINKE
jgi:hypothetical protein